MRLTVSVVIPNYNHGHLLPQAVAALQAQSRPPDEIVIVDDGSTDGSQDVVRGLLAADPRIRSILHGTNRGAIAALNSGIAAAKGDLVYLGAADDVALPTLIATLAELSETYPGLGLYCGELRMIDGETGGHALRPAVRPSNGPAGFSSQQVRRLFRRIDNFILTGAALIDRRKLLAAGSLQPELGSFADGFAVRQLALQHGFAFTPGVIAEWRVSDDGLSRTTASDPEAVDRLLDIVGSAFAREAAFPPGYGRLFARRWKFAVLRLELLRKQHDAELLSRAAPGPRPLRRFFGTVVRLPVLGRPLGLAWLTLAYRPVSLWALAATALNRGRRHP